jgi:hypothetical protein
MHDGYSGLHARPIGDFGSSKEITMRFSTMAAAVCLSLSAVARSHAAAPPAPRADTTTTPPRADTAAPPSSDAAARHAKRRACLKDARAKKLIGADKTSFLKACIAA